MSINPSLLQSHEFSIIDTVSKTLLLPDEKIDKILGQGGCTCDWFISVSLSSCELFETYYSRQEKISLVQVH